MEDSFNNGCLGTQSSDLTGIFPGIEIQHRLPTPVPAVKGEKEKNQTNLDEHTKNVPDFLTKVLRYSLTNTEEHRIATYDYGNEMRERRRRGLIQQEGKEDSWSPPDYQQSEDVQDSRGCVDSIPIEFYIDGRKHQVIAPIRQSTPMPGAVQVPCAESREVPMVQISIPEIPEPKSTMSEIRTESQNNGRRNDEDSMSSAAARDEAEFRNQERIHKLLGSLSPIRTSEPEIGTQESDRSSTYTLLPPFIEAERKEQAKARQDGESASMIVDTEEIRASSVSQDIAAVVQQVRHATVRCVDGEIQETGLQKHDFPMVHRRMLGEV